MSGRWVFVISWAIGLTLIGSFAAYVFITGPNVPLDLLLVPRNLTAIAGAVAIYVIAATIAACGWYVLVREGGAGSIATGVFVVLMAQLAKYVPGNVVQIAGRIALARLYGFDTARTAAATTLEIVLGVAAAGLVAFVALLSAEWPVEITAAFDTIAIDRLALVGVVALIAVASVLVVRLHPSIKYEWFRAIVPSGAALWSALGLFIIVQIVAGMALQLVAEGVFTVGKGDFAWILASMVVASTAGFLTPGAPGGLGVREGLLTAMLAPLFGTGVALGIALSFRIVTTIGDLVGFLAGFLGLQLLRRSS